MALGAALLVAGASPAGEGIPALALAVSPAAAATTVIGFDDQPSGTVIGEQYAALGVHFGPSPFAGLSGGFTAAARAQSRSAPNVATFAYNPGTDFSSSWIKFDKQQSKVSFYACRTGGVGDPPMPNVNVLAFDSNGDQVDNQQGIVCSLNGPLVPVMLAKDHITYLNVYGTGGSAALGRGWALDDLTFETDPKPPPPPPPPTPPTHGDPPPPPQALTLQPAGCPQRGSGFVGTAGNETINGTALSDVILGLGGNDTLRGLAGNDCLYGGSGLDRISGGSGTDRANGEAGNDAISGDAGNDNLSGNAASDTLSGDAGNDTLSGDAGNDNLSGGSGSDGISGGSGSDRISGGSSSDRISGGSSSDRISGGSGRDRISSGAGNDRISARDGVRDRVDCGTGRDRVTADRRDLVARNCEAVRRR